MRHCCQTFCRGTEPCICPCRGCAVAKAEAELLYDPNKKLSCVVNNTLRDLLVERERKRVSDRVDALALAIGSVKPPVSLVIDEELQFDYDWATFAAHTAPVAVVSTPWHPGSIFGVMHDPLYGSYSNASVHQAAHAERIKRDEEALQAQIRKQVYERLSVAPEFLREFDVKVYKAKNVEFRIDGKLIEIGGVEADFAGAQVSIEAPTATTPAVVATITIEELDHISDLIKSTTITREQVVSLLGDILPKEVRTLRTPRGSWFAYPKTQPEEPVKIHANVERQKRLELGDAEYEKWARGIATRAFGKRQRELMDATPERLKNGTYASWLDVVCMHCGHQLHFEIVERWLRCPKCTQDYWPNGGYREAQLALAITGDLGAFQEMLMYPPEGL